MYHVFIEYSRTLRVTLWLQVFRDYERAAALRRKRELETLCPQHLEILVISASNLETIREHHPKYFRKMRKCISVKHETCIK